MKNRLNGNYLIIALYAFGVISISILFALLLGNFKDLGTFFMFFLDTISPFIYALVIAYLLNPVMAFAENKIFRFRKKPKFALRRALSVIVAYIFGIAVVSVLLLSIIPQLTKSTEMLINNFNLYKDNLEILSRDFLSKFGGFNNIFGDSIQSFNDILDNIMVAVKKSLPLIMDTMKQGAIELKNFFLGLIISVYLLYGKEKLISQFKKFLSAFLPRKLMENLLEITKFSHETVTDFLIGKTLDSVIVGLLCFISMSILNLEYSLLISFVVGITNIIPYFGPFIGAIPSILILLIVNPMEALIFTILITVLQQIDGNIIGPKILGESLGLSSFWVIFAIIVMSGFFGVWGMFLGVPVFAIIYHFTSKYVNSKLTRKNLPTDTDSYLLYDGKDFKF
ncbi:MAG: AI-2E family transporter [Clostridia bacterium]|nr:AI-2E family transporter [Clostridia bacterium]